MWKRTVCAFSVVFLYRPNWREFETPPVILLLVCSHFSFPQMHSFRAMSSNVTKPFGKPGVNNPSSASSSVPRNNASARPQTRGQGQGQGGNQVQYSRRRATEQNASFVPAFSAPKVSPPPPTTMPNSPAVTETTDQYEKAGNTTFQVTEISTLVTSTASSSFKSSKPIANDLFDEECYKTNLQSRFDKIKRSFNCK